ncbi:MAG TPA: hypothetical protein VMB18_04210 [Terriglobales bacterium]|jgi:hypothetical protein|nr:hypothetical protein [Terriglobales bacterium]
MGFWQNRWDDLRPNLLWLVLSWVFGGGVIAAGTSGIQRLRHFPLDWLAITGTFAFSALGLAVLSFLVNRPRLNSEPESPEGQSDTASLKAERDRLQQDNKELQERVLHFETKLNQSLESLGQFKAELDEVYADVILCWLKDCCSGTCTLSTDEAVKATELEHNQATAGMGWLAAHELLKKTPLGWTYAATIATPRYRKFTSKHPWKPRQPEVGGSVNDSDPRVYIVFQDDRGSVTGDTPENSLDLVNRGGSTAKMVCVDDIVLKDYTITFPSFGYAIIPGNGCLLSPNILKADGPDYVGNMVEALMREWFTYKDYNKHELAIPIFVTYQDEQRNLFETRCELVLHPGEEAKVKQHGLLPGMKVVETRNHQFRKLAALITSSASHSTTG